MRTFKIFLNTFFRLTHLSYNHLITDTHPQPPSLPFEKFLTNCVYSDSTLTHSWHYLLARIHLSTRQRLQLFSREPPPSYNVLTQPTLNSYALMEQRPPFGAISFAYSRGQQHSFQDCRGAVPGPETIFSQRSGHLNFSPFHIKIAKLHS